MKRPNRVVVYHFEQRMWIAQSYEDWMRTKDVRQCAQHSPTSELADMHVFTAENVRMVLSDGTGSGSDNMLRLMHSTPDALRTHIDRLKLEGYDDDLADVLNDQQICNVKGLLFYYQDRKGNQEVVEWMFQ